MRRFYQIIILVIAFCSLLAFLAYKHEYDRLKNILQVLNTFGHDPTAAKNCRSGSKREEIEEMTTKVSTFGGWRQFDITSSTSFYLYSAFWNRTDRTIRIHGISTDASGSQSEWNRCAFYSNTFESDRPRYRLGSLEIKRDVVRERTKWVPVMLECKAPSVKSGEDPNTQPLAVSFVNERKRSTPTINVEVATTTSKKVDSVAICTSVTDGGLVDEGIIVQFVEYHRYVGVDRLVIYADGLSSSVLRRIVSLATKYREARIEILPWNAPFATDGGERKSAANAVMKRDCLERVGQEFSYVLFLEIHELVVSRYHSHLLNFVKDEANVAEDSLGGLRLARRFFCLEFEDDPQQKMSTDLYVMQYKSDLLTLPPMFTKTKWIDEVADIENETYLVENGGLPILTATHSFPRVNPEYASIHAYIRCDSDSENLSLKPNNRPKYDDIVIKKIKNQFL